VSPVELRCTAPAYPRSTALPAPYTSSITVTNNGADFADTGAVYTYRPAALPVELQPSSGPLRGGTVVTVRGTGFAGSSARSSSNDAAADHSSNNTTAAASSNRTADSVTCQFTFAAGGAVTPRAAVVVVPALSVSATAVRCVTPVSPLLRAGSVVLEVADSGGLTTAGLLFNYR
jgi:hypothetical protein